MGDDIQVSESNPNRLSGVADLPYDLILYIFALLPADDILHLLSTCRGLRAHLRDESIWRELCSRHGVYDLLNFPGRTFFGLYASILHTYGPLIGLWASDFPFRGNVMEFRFVTGTNDWQGIVGEVWIFPRLFDDMDDPSLPSYWQSIQIRLPELPETPIPKPAIVSWFIHTEQNVWVDEWTKQQLYPTFHRVSPTRQSVFFHWSGQTGHRMSTRHPDFVQPGIRPWYDDTRGLPRMEVDGSFTNPSSLTRNLGMAPALVSAPSEVETPEAISIVLPVRTDPVNLHDPIQPFPDLRHAQVDTGYFPSRYYPLRFPRIVRGLSFGLADGDEWPLGLLEGVWLGAYGAHGTEVLYLSSSVENNTEAWKVTGDTNIPRGVVSWWFSHQNRIGPQSIPPGAEFGELPQSCRLYEGKAHICGAGFVPTFEQWIGCTVALITSDDIKIYWESLRHTSRFRRYPGRDIPSEEAPPSRGGVRVPTLWN